MSVVGAPRQAKVLEPEVLHKLEEVVVRHHAENDETLSAVFACLALCCGSLAFHFPLGARPASRDGVTVELFVYRSKSKVHGARTGLGSFSDA